MFKTRKSRLLRYLALGVGAVIGVAGCTAGGPAGGDDSRASTVVVAYNVPVDSLDPVNADFSQPNLVEQALYDTLVTYDADNQLVGRLASEFTVSPDARSIDVTIRDGVRFHDGAEVTAEDVAYSLDRYSRLGTGVAQFIASYDASEIVDDKHLTIRLKRADSLFVGGLSKIYILNSALVEQNVGSDDAQGWLARNDAGSGPYALTSVRGEQIEAGRFEDYWDHDAARPETLLYRLVKESATQRDELLAGTLDVTTTLTGTDLKALDGADGVEIVDEPVRVQAYVFFNMIEGPTTNPAVRKAIQLAYDYQGGLAIRGGFGTVANGPLPTTVACHPELPTYAQDLAKARQLLADAGISDLTLTMHFQTENPVWRQEATLLQSNLKAIGIALKLQPITFLDYLARLSDPDQIPQMMLLEDFAQFPDPGVMLRPYYLSTAVGTNRSGYQNARVDELIQQALATADETQACDSYEQAQRLIHEDAVALNMYTVGKPFAYRSGLAGVHPTTVGNGVWVPDIRVS